MAWYSSLGNVKLSRTSLGFLSFVSAAAWAIGAALTVGLAVAFFVGADADLLAGRLAGFLETTGLALAGALAGDLAGDLRGAFLAALRNVFLAAGGAV